MNLIEDIKSISSSKHDLRKFAWIMAIVFTAWGVIFLFRGARHEYFLMISLFFLIAGWIYPFWVFPLYKVAAVTTVFWRWFLAKVLLWGVFFLGFTLMNFGARIFGKRFLSVSFDKNIDSYWISKEKSSLGKGDYERQF